MFALASFLAAILVAAAGLQASSMPAGTKLEVRLATEAGSRISHPGDPITATVIAPAAADGHPMNFQGATVSGVVENAQALGLGFKHRFAGLKLRFNSLRLLDGTVLPIDARVGEVETARERVDQEGEIVGIDPSANLSSGISFLISAFLIDTELAAPAIAAKFMIVRSPDPEIYLPVGTELFLETTKDTFVGPSIQIPDMAVPLKEEDVTAVKQLLGGLPQQQARVGKKHASDLVNLLLLGSADQIKTAFHSAGWTGESKHSVLALYRIYHCMVQRMGYSMAPMDRITLNGSLATEVYQKSLDTFAKRHHIRLWNEPDSKAWLGAATEDISFALRRMHLTHAIDMGIDNERAKVVNDLWFTGCVDSASLLSRASLKPIREKGESLFTDGNIAVLKMNSCEHPHAASVPQAHQRSRAAKAFDAIGNDIARSNPVTVVFSLARSVWVRSQADEKGFSSMAGLSARKSGSAAPVGDRRASVIEGVWPASAGRDVANRDVANHDVTNRDASPDVAVVSVSDSPSLRDEPQPPHSCLIRQSTNLHSAISNY